MLFKRRVVFLPLYKVIVQSCVPYYGEDMGSMEVQRLTMQMVAR